MPADHHDQSADDFDIDDIGATFNRCLDHDDCYELHAHRPGVYHFRPGDFDELNARFIAALDNLDARGRLHRGDDTPDPAPVRGTGCTCPYCVGHARPYLDPAADPA